MTEHNTPLVTIVSSSFNRGELFKETAESVFNQTYSNWEWYIVDDHSHESTFEILNAVADKDERVHVLKRTGEDKGANICRNQGADKGSGKYILFLDDDDLLSDFAVKQRVEAMETNPELDFGIFPSLMFEKEMYDLNKWWNVEKETPDIVRQLNKDPICQLAGALYKRESFNNVGKLDGSLQLWQDIDFFLRLYIEKFKYKKFFSLPPDLHIRVSPGSLSRGNFLRADKTYSRVRVVRKIVGLLKETNQPEFIQYVTPMYMEVIYALLRIGHTDKADELLNWGIEEDIIDKKEYNKLKKLRNIYKFKLYKLGFGEKLAASLTDRDNPQNTIGTITYKSA